MAEKGGNSVHVPGAFDNTTLFWPFPEPLMVEGALGRKLPKNDAKNGKFNSEGFKFY